MSFTTDTLKVLRKAPPESLLPIYERHGIDPSEKEKALLEDVCLDGANSIASIFRGWEGVDYDEIVTDVAEELGIQALDRTPRQLELAILEFIISKYLENATPEERSDIAAILKKAGGEFNDRGEILKGIFAKGALALLIRSVGEKVVGQVVGKIMIKIGGRQVAKQAGKQAARMAGMAIPVLNVIMVGWTVVDIAGPAFRKTVPTVIEIALLRLEYGSEV
jgi:uncharacterized protein YaaW (UPF0174 family)